jgi:hypothetical protein
MLILAPLDILKLVRNFETSVSNYLKSNIVCAENIEVTIIIISLAHGVFSLGLFSQKISEPLYLSFPPWIHTYTGAVVDVLHKA